MLSDDRAYRRQLTKNFLQSTVGAAVNLVKPPPRRFAIFTSGRAGSNYLVSILKSHPKIWIHSEIFGEYALESHNIRRRINRIGAGEYLEMYFRRMGLEDVVGIKFIYHQVYDDYGATRDISGLEALREKMLKDPGMRFIHLVREDILSVVLSKRLALETGKWERGSYGLEAVRIDPEWMLREFDEIRGFEDVFDEVLPADRTYRMSYEELVADAETKVAEVCRFLGVKPVSFTYENRKQNDQPARNLVENYDELVEFFRGGRHETLF